MTPPAKRRSTRILFYSSRTLSQAGQSLMVASLFIIAGSGEAMALGLSSVMAGMMAAAILLGMPAGGLGDALGPPRALATGATLRLLTIGATFFVIGSAELAWVMAFAYSAASQLFSPAELALLPAIEGEKASRGHAALVVLQYAGQGLGMLVLVPGLYFLGGVETMLLGSVAIYGGVTAIALAMSVRLRGGVEAPALPARRAFNFGAIASFFNREPRASYAAGLLAFTEMSTKCLIVVAPVYVAQELGLSKGEMLTVGAPGIAGAVVGLVWAARSQHGGATPQMMRLALAAIVVSMVALSGLADGLSMGARAANMLPLYPLHDASDVAIGVAVPIALLLGLVFGLAPIGARTVLTETTPRGQGTRIFATQATLTDVLTIVPLLVAGASAEMAGARVSFLMVAGIGAIIFVLLETVALSRGAAPVPMPRATVEARSG